MISSGVGNFQFGGLVYNEPYNLNDYTDKNKDSTRKRTQVGFYQLGRRGYLRPEVFLPRILNNTGLPDATILITSVSGAAIGTIRTDVKNSIVKDIRFTTDKHGCADFKLKLNRLPSFPIPDNSLIFIKLFDTDFWWYSGEISYPDKAGTNTDYYEFSGLGLRHYLKDLKAFITIPAGTDIADIIKIVVADWISPYCPIKTNYYKMANTTGIVIANDVKLGKYSVEKILQTFSQMATLDDKEFIYGVDGDGDFYFKDVSKIKINKTFFVGYEINDFKPKLNMQEIRNAILVQRQVAQGSNVSGWESPLNVFNDPTSVKKYGEKRLDFQIPGYFHEDEMTIIGNALLTDKKDPKLSASIKNKPINESDDYLELGQYRFVLPLDKYDELYSDVDILGEWTKYGTGDLVISKEDDIYVHGDGCIKLTSNNSINDRAEIYKHFSGKIENIRFYIRSNAIGQFCKAGIGLTNWNEITTNINIPIRDKFIPIDWNISNLNLNEFRFFAIQITEDIEAEIYIDEIQITMIGHKTYKMPIEKTTYSIGTNGLLSSHEFGILPAKIENYLAGLMETSKNLKATGEVT